MGTILAAARDLLGMELAYLSELGDEELVLREVAGDKAAMGGVDAGARMPRGDAWCSAMVDGKAASLVPDTDSDPDALDHPFVQRTGIRAYVGVPVRREDGTVLGTLCCVSRTPRPELGTRDVQALDALARLAADHLDLTAHAEGRRAELEAAAGQALVAALNARENYTAEHSEAVLALALEVAEELGLDDGDAAEVAQVALLHDIGKVGVPDAILRKPGALTAPEWEIMREHPAIGARIVGAIPSLAHLAPAVRAEHERWDGRGYPDGLAGEAVPLSSRICFVCDAWHAMTSDRPYRRALSVNDARAELERHIGTQFCPATSAALLRVLDRRDGQLPPPPAPVLAPLPSLRPESALEAELRALIDVSSAVAAAHRLDDVLEVVAEQALSVLRAASVSINRWEPDLQVSRALVNVGRLGPREERRPAEETWGLTGLGGRLIREGRSFAVSLDDPDLPSDERVVLQRLGKGSMVAAPILVDGRVWGRLDAFAERGRPPFSGEHVRFVEALCGQVSAAIGRAELFSRLEALAYRDGLTGLPNRRALDERLDGAVAAGVAGGTGVALVFCDLDGLKGINDRDGHDAGDRALCEAARALEEAAETFSGSFVARLGGDEFCVLMEGHGADAARALARDASHRLAAAAGTPLTFSCGVACLDEERRRAADLFRAADAAQYAAKRVGGGRTFVAQPGAPGPSAPHDRWSRRRFRDAGPHEREALATFVLDRLDGDLAGADALARLEFVTGAFADAYDVAKWAISHRPSAAPHVRTVVGADRRGRFNPDAADVSFAVEDDVYPLADYPATAGIMGGGGFALAADDHGADARERALLEEWGFTALTAAAAPAPDGGAWLVELFADARTHVLDGAVTSLRLLAGEAVRRAGGQDGAVVTSRAKVSKTST